MGKLWTVSVMKEKKDSAPLISCGFTSDNLGIMPADSLEKKIDRLSLVLHSCCGPCSSSVIERLAGEFNITVLYYNPCITDEEEYKKRMRASNRRRYVEDPAFRNAIRARITATSVLKKLDLKRPDFLILHCFGPIGKSFMYLHRDEHCAIRRWVRGRNKVYFDVILEHPELISSAYVIDDGKLAMILRGTKKVDFEVKWPFNTKKVSRTCKTVLKHCKDSSLNANKSALEAVKSLTTSNPKGVEKRS